MLTTGGASRGEEDHLVTSLDAVGKRHLWQLAVKPGRPMSFGQVGDCPVVALPGNPVAAFVCFLLYVRPMLTVMGGGAWPEPQRFEVAAGFEIATRKTGRREFLRGRLVRRRRRPPGGKIRARRLGPDHVASRGGRADRDRRGCRSRAAGRAGDVPALFRAGYLAAQMNIR